MDMKAYWFFRGWCWGFFWGMLIAAGAVTLWVLR